mgnify:FL=1|tara:strand:- start:390 stop:824 length:435 start_codon:yes stop_codon:yes gene_type:complete
MFKQGTQKQILHDYLLTGKSITTKQAITELGFADLQGVIRDLKKAGVKINTLNRKVNTRYTKADGSTKYAYVKEYTLGEDDEEVWTFRTAEEQAEWENFSDQTPLHQHTKNIIESKHIYNIKSTKVNDERQMSNLQHHLHIKRK